MRPIKYGDTRKILTAVADYTLVLAPPMKRHYMVTGTGALFWIVLPDARTIPIGTPFLFENYGTEILGVRNSSSTTWERVPPRWTLTCTLVSNATAAGVWSTALQADPRPKNGLYQLCDFLGCVASTTNGAFGGLTATCTGTSSTVTPVNTAGYTQGNMQGVIDILYGTTAGAFSYLHEGLTGTLLGGAARFVEVRQAMALLSVVSPGNEYVCEIGMHDDIAGAPPANGLFFRYDRLTTGTDLWYMCTNDGTGLNAVATAVAPVVSNSGTVWQKLRVEVNSGRTRADFWIDNVQVSAAGGITAKIPGAATLIKAPNLGIWKSAGGNGRGIICDYVAYGSFPVTPR
jgi:hypothetical protein